MIILDEYRTDKSAWIILLLSIVLEQNFRLYWNGDNRAGDSINIEQTEISDGFILGGFRNRFCVGQDNVVVSQLIHWHSEL